MELTKSLLLILLAITVAVSGQFCLKKTMNEIGVIELKSEVNYVQKATSVMKKPLFWLGLVFYGVGMIAWLIVLSRVDLSFAYPMLSISYVVIMIVSALHFGEQITLNRVIGTFLIIGGVVFISRS